MGKSTASLLCMGIIALLFACTSCNSSGETDGRIRKMDSYLSAQADHFRFNGNVLVAEKGKIIFRKSYGLANFDTKRPLNDSSVFELASVSKQFTAAAILLLRDKGMLKLTDSLRQYFPELPYPGITLYHILTHTSGLPDYESAMNEKWDRKKIAFNPDMISFLAREKPPVLFQPGAKWEYSNTGYALLASIVEKVSGQVFHAFLSDNMFTPLRMGHSRIYNTRRSLKDTIPNYAFGFVYDDSLKTYRMPDSVRDLHYVYYLDGIQGDGVVNSNTADLLTWDRALQSFSLLPEATMKEMTQRHALVDTSRKTYYGFGVFLDSTEYGNMVSHSGGWPGYATYLARNTDKDQTIILLSNNNSNSPALAQAIHALMNGGTVVMPYKHAEIKVDSGTLKQFVGTYKASNDMRIEQRGDTLWRVYPGGGKMRLVPESDRKFFYADESDRQIEFELDDKNKVTKAWMIAYGMRTAYQKSN